MNKLSWPALTHLLVPVLHVWRSKTNGLLRLSPRQSKSF